MLSTSNNDDDHPYQEQKVTDNSHMIKESVMLSILINCVCSYVQMTIQCGLLHDHDNLAMMSTYIHGPLELYIASWVVMWCGGSSFPEDNGLEETIENGRYYTICTIYRIYYSH